LNGSTEDIYRINRPMITNDHLPSTTQANYAAGGFGVNASQSTYSGDASHPATVVTNTGMAQAKDHDTVVRPGDAALGESQADPMTVSSARPVILNRPFRSVGELGYVFRDQPWKTLNFFTDDSSSNQQLSADAALLDVFCLEDTDVETAPADTRNNLIAGQIDLNTQNKKALAALLAGTITNYTQGAALNNSDATTISDELTTFTKDHPIFSPAELVTKFLGDSTIKSKVTAPFSAVKQEREAIVRALASTGQARTWNLLIDVIAQSGRYPNTASTTDLSKFQVEGERRYWLHVAIDRLTGKVIAKQLEPVVE
jgi:hypothetical protein